MSIHALHRSDKHTFTKQAEQRLTLVAGCGVEGDAHFGATVKHRSRVRKDPTQPNLRQVHLFDREILTEATEAGFSVAPGDLGENITVEGLNLVEQPIGSTLVLGSDVLICLTGLRNPCGQINGHAKGLMQFLAGEGHTHTAAHRSGVMAVVIRGGIVEVGDEVFIAPPPGAPRRLIRV